MMFCEHVNFVFFQVFILQCLYTANTHNSDDQIIGDYTKHSVCITDKHDTISSFYHQITFDPRSPLKNKESELLCDNRTIWISEDTKYVIYYELLSDLMISHDKNIAGFGIFECSQDAYLSALKAQPMDIASDNLCVNPTSIYPDSYAGHECTSSPLVYCLPLNDESQCPQAHVAMTSMYNKLDLEHDMADMHHFYECKCWFRPNAPQQMRMQMNFNEGCRPMQIQQENKMKEVSYHQLQREEREKEKDMNGDDEIDIVELERSREFSILWATLGLIIGVLLLIIIVIYSCKKQYHKKMYLTSRKYMRYTHFGDIENEGLIAHHTDDEDTETDSELTTTSGDTTDDTDLNSEITDLSAELACL